MKYATLFLAPLSASALSNVAPGTFQRNLKGIDGNDVFDPTSGENAPLTYNNKNEVWVPQVFVELFCNPYNSYEYLMNLRNTYFIY
jgi:hypothetical protein